MVQENKEVVIDRTLKNKFYLHKLMQNGGSMKFNNFGIKIVHNPNNPQNPYVEVQLFAIPMGVTYKGNVNPSLHKVNKSETEKPIEIEEEESIEM